MVMLPKRVTAALTVVLSGLVLAASLSGPANASQSLKASSMTDGAAVGLLVHFKPGFSANGLFGALNGQDSVTSQGIAVTGQRALGSGWHELTFAGAVSEATANRAMAAMQSQPGVESVAIDRFIAAPAAAPAGTASSAATSLSAKQLLPATTVTAPSFKGASAARSVVAIDGFDTAEPNLAQIKLSWRVPASLGGYRLAGYRLQASMDGGVTTEDFPNLLSSKTNKALVNQGLTAGTQVYLRVAAVTTNGKASKVGTYSAWASAIPTTVPVPPNFGGPSVNSDKPTTTWQLLTTSEAGGLPVTYVATATAANQQSVNCTSTTSSCTFQGLVPGVVYTVSLRAENKHGSSASVTGLAVTDPDYPLQWHLNSKYGINVESAWQHTRGSSNVTVAVVDSGITDHPDLNGNIWHNPDGTVYGYDFVSIANGPGDGDGWDASPMDPTADNEWHGTHVSGIIAASANNIGGIGVAPGVKLLEVRALGTKGGTSGDLIAALNWAAGKDVPGVPKNQHPAQVVNLSLGNKTYSQCDTGTANVMQSLHDLNVMVITAAGNDNSQGYYSYPGNCYPTINVGATGYTGDRAFYSNYGQGVDISAPGGDDQTPGDAPAKTQGRIWSTMNDGTVSLGLPTYSAEQGTSMAAPMVSGIAALLYSLKPNITPDQIWTTLKYSVTPFPAGSACAVAGKDQSCGIGIANAGAAIEYAIKNLP